MIKDMLKAFSTGVKQEVVRRASKPRLYIGLPTAALLRGFDNAVDVIVDRQLESNLQRHFADQRGRSLAREEANRVWPVSRLT